MTNQGRQVLLALALGSLPAALLLLTLWVYELLVESMKNSLHEQRASALQSFSFEKSVHEHRNFAWAVLKIPEKRFSLTSHDWPKNIDEETLLRFLSIVGSGTEKGIEIDSSSGPAILWIIPCQEGYKAAFQHKRNFYARLESLRILIWTAGLLLAGGTFVVFVTIVRRLSDLFNEMEAKNLELERANRNLAELGTLKSNFLALVSHELRTPLARISGQMQIINHNRHLLPPELQSRFDDINAEVMELTRMTKNVLDLTRLQSEDLSARMELGQITKLVLASVDRIRPYLPARGLEIVVETPETPPVQHDPYLLERILDNLLINAVKYSTKNGKISVRVVEEEKFVRVEVDSSGEPIPPGDREKIFEKFFRLGERTDIPGTGLGLYLVRQFILMMGGRTWVEPSEIGNKFVITLPFG